MAQPTLFNAHTTDGATCQSPTDVLSALADPDSRHILEATARRPRSVPEIVEACDIPTATAYRKVNALADVGLLEEHIRIRSSGKNISKYELGASKITVSIDNRDGVTCDWETSPSRDPFEDVEFTDEIVISPGKRDNPLTEPPR